MGKEEHDMQPQSNETPNPDETICYVLFNSRAPGQHKLDRFTDEIRDLSDAQVEMADVSTPEGEKIRNKYSILSADLPAVLLIRHDSLTHHWLTPYLPSARDIAHYLR